MTNVKGEENLCVSGFQTRKTSAEDTPGASLLIAPLEASSFLILTSSWCHQRIEISFKMARLDRFPGQGLKYNQNIEKHPQSNHGGLSECISINTFFNCLYACSMLFYLKKFCLIMLIVVPFDEVYSFFFYIL